LKGCACFVALIPLFIFLSTGFAADIAAEVGIYDKFKGQGISINVYNWGEYMSNGSDGKLNVNKEFEKLTGIHVNYTTFASNEEMYAKISSGSVVYDVIIPSDYMISRMISEKLLARLDFLNIPNAKNVMPEFGGLEYDPTGAYSVPYMWGTVGVVYNSREIKGEVDGFDALWDKKLKRNILMFSNSRDAFAIALKKLGFSFNTENREEILRAQGELKKQKELVQAYVMDEIFDKMQSEEAWIAPCYSGVALAMMKGNKDLRFVLPSGGTSRFVDAACVPISSKKKEAAELYINFLNEPEVACANALYSDCSTPNLKAFEMLPEEIKNSKIAYPDAEVLKNTRCYRFGSQELGGFIESLWIEVLVGDEDNDNWVMPVFIVVCVAAVTCIGVLRVRGKRRKSDVYAGSSKT
jgi:spermidine/putrescine transport system substrate-binding protein